MRARLITIVAVLATAGLLAAACGGSSSSSGTSSSGPSGVLTIDNESGGTWTCNFNPFNLSYISYSMGNVYEPLVFINTLNSGQASPWLASSWAWGSGNKTLTFTIRSGVKFSNGDPLTAADVAYTFNPVTYPDKNPVGTGAFTVSSKTCTPQNIKYTANPHYWQKGLPKVATVNYPSFMTNDTANTFLANGQAQWGGQFIPNIKSFYTSKSPNYHYWFPPVANVSLFINLTNPILKNVAVRQAMAYAINRQKASTIGEYGYEPASNQAGIVTPTFSSWLDNVGETIPARSEE